MMLRIRHTTLCSYGASTGRGAHVLRLRPRNLPCQHVHSFALDAVGLSVRRTESIDQFGNAVSRLFIEEPHAALELRTEAVVATRPRPPIPESAVTPAWERIVRAALRDPAEVADFTFASPLTPPSTLLRAWASISFPPARPVLAGVLELLDRARTCPQMEVPAHRVLAGLRALGLPARIVSGYVPTRSPATGLGIWIACWLGPDWGWVDLDPETGAAIGVHHVALCWGRDGSDVQPVWSVPQSTSVHEVAMHRGGAEGTAALLPALRAAR